MEKEKWLNTLLRGDEVDEFETVQRHLRIRTNADVVRYLIGQEARRIAGGDGQEHDEPAALEATGC